MITPALANAEDIARLFELERQHRMPVGFTAMSVKQSIAYLERIAYLSATSHGQRQPKVYIDEYVNDPKMETVRGTDSTAPEGH